uniref:Uncharacterized protein n=1 Tax=Salix viminalis TaxID=40686 RepID=A0A6N2LWQ2_SALVM
MGICHADSVGDVVPANENHKLRVEENDHIKCRPSNLHGPRLDKLSGRVRCKVSLNLFRENNRGESFSEEGRRDEASPVAPLGRPDSVCTPVINSSDKRGPCLSGSMDE